MAVWVEGSRFSAEGSLRWFFGEADGGNFSGECIAPEDDSGVLVVMDVERVAVGDLYADKQTETEAHEQRE